MRNYLDIMRDQRESAIQYRVTTNDIVFMQLELICTFRKIEQGRKMNLSEIALKNLAYTSFMNSLKEVYRTDELLKMYPLTNHVYNMIHRMVDGKTVELFY